MIAKKIELKISEWLRHGLPYPDSILINYEDWRLLIEESELGTNIEIQIQRDGKFQGLELIKSYDIKKGEIRVAKTKI